MTSSADARRLLVPGLALLLALLPPPVGAHAADVPPAFEGQARAEIARRWNVAPDRVRLEWSEPAPVLEAGDSLRRVAGGEGGWFSAVTARAGDRFALRVRASMQTDVEVASRALATGERLGPFDLHRESRWIVPSRSVSGPDVEPGWEVRRPIASGELLAWPAVAPPPLIEAGQHVTAIWERGDVQVRLEGRALQGARAGRPLRVRVAGSDRAVTAVAIGPGQVRIQGGFDR